MSAPTVLTERLERAATAPEPAARAPERRSPKRGGPGGLAVLMQRARWWPAPAIAGVLSAVAFLAKGGLNLTQLTAVEMALTIGSALVAAGAIVLTPAERRVNGGWALGLLLAFSALTALSIVWSVQPDASWQDAGRMFAFSGVFGASIALARAAPGRWAAVLDGVVLAAVVVCGWAVLTKVFPGQLDAKDIYARLRAPYTYWNAIGLTAAMGAVGCLWLGSRRKGHAVLSALAYPAMGLTLLTLLLAYSRGALAAFAVGLMLWFCVVPLRLRGATVLLAGAIGAAGVAAFAFRKHALSSDYVPLAARSAAGHQLGVLIAVMLIALTVVGILVGFQSARTRRSQQARRHAGAILLSVLALALLGFVGALAASHRGLTGSVSHAFHSLTDPHARVPPNTPGRLTAIASVRARYWNEALKVWKAHPWLGSGAEGYATARLRYRNETLDVRHAHGYIVQTLADLGLAGLAVTLALLACWMAACGRATHPFNRRWSGWPALAGWRLRKTTGARERRWPVWRAAPLPYSPERIGMLTMLALVVVFGVHSLVDWTWYVPGDACVALLCAGWLAGRGELDGATAGGAAPALSGASAEPAGVAHAGAGGEAPARARLRFSLPRAAEVSMDARAAAVAAAVLVAALLAAWAQWQPQRSVDASQRALAQLRRSPGEAEASARSAVSRDPLSAQALFTLAAIQQANARPLLARSTLQHAVGLQPSNPQTWLALGQFDLEQAQAGTEAQLRAHAALEEVAAAIYLDPELIAPEEIASGNREAITAQNDYLLALRMSGGIPAGATARGLTLPSSARRP